MARRQPLSAPVRALGSAIREFHTLEARGAKDGAAAEKTAGGSVDTLALPQARAKVDAALVDALGAGEEPLVELRAVQLEEFLSEADRFETTGEQSPELEAVAGGFVRAMTAEGWCVGHTLLPRRAELRVMYKEMWNAFLGVSERRAFRPSLDELRALYAFYLSHPHPTKAMRLALDAVRRGARDAKACAALVEGEQIALEAWRAERVKSLATLDPSYPGDYALGIVQYRRGDYGGAVAAFRRWLQVHPDGPWTLRAQNYLRAAVDAAARD
jgi:hypothetical protein